MVVSSKNKIYCRGVVVIKSSFVINDLTLYIYIDITIIIKIKILTKTKKNYSYGNNYRQNNIEIQVWSKNTR